MEIVSQELSKLGLPHKGKVRIEAIRQQKGVFLYRVWEDCQPYVLKYFQNKEFRREIQNYDLLQQLNIPTIKVIATTESSILLEDLEVSKEYRLGIASDLSDISVARALARWYIDLHNKGSKYIKENDVSFYREIDAITKENILWLMAKSNTQSLKVWDLILQNFDDLWEKINSLEKTLNYNDFYWTNLAVSHDYHKALMFDYNFLGSGFRYNDIRNVCSSLSGEARNAFLAEYGKINEDEKVVDEVTSILFDLIIAYQQSSLPKWSQSFLESLHNGKLEENFKKIFKGKNNKF